MHLRNVSGATGPKSSGTSCFARRSCKRMSCHGHAHDRGESPRTTASPRRVRACMLASRDICLRLSRHVAFALQRHWRHVVTASQMRLHRVTPLHGDARCSSDRRSGRNGNCSPTRVASSARWRRRAVAVSTNSLLEDRAPSPAPDAWLRTHQNVRSHGFFTNSSAHGRHRQQNKLGKRCKQFKQFAEA